VQVCTVINKAWLAHARALAESLREHEPGARLSVLIVDAIDDRFDPAAEPFEVLEAPALQIEQFDEMSARYDVTELCCALKPVLIRYLLGSGEPVVYLDSDVRLFAPLDGLERELDAHPFLLTPHLLAPLPEDGREPSELAILLAGTSNLGFAAARASPEVESLLNWWAQRLCSGSRLEPARGVVYDQRWTDLMPGYSEQVGHWRDPGVNAGYWRAAGSSFELRDGAPTVDGVPLRTFHFTGFDPERPERLSKYDNRTSLQHEPALTRICEQFAECLREADHEQCSRWPYGFAKTASGAPMSALLRELWDRAHAAGAVQATPFTPDGERALLGWLGEPEDATAAAAEALSRYLTALHAATPDLQERFPDPSGEDRDALLAWASEQAEREPHGVLGLLRAHRQPAHRGGLHELSPGEPVGAARGEIVVCIPVYGAPGLFAECLTSVLAHTPVDVPILIADDASPDPAIREFVRSLGGALQHSLHYLRQPQNLGFPGNVNSGFLAAAPADVVVLNSDCQVAEGWLEGLRRAACSDALVATVSALTNHGTILSVPERNRPVPDIPQDQDLAHAAGAVRMLSPRFYPHLPTAIGHCMYIRRQALDLVGEFDLAFSPGYGEEVDFSQRCVLQGLVHIAADDVFVLHHAGGSFGADGQSNPMQREHDRIVEARYPYYARATEAAASATFGRLPRAIASAKRAIGGLTVTIDGRCLGPLMTGTQVHTLQLIKALDATDRVGIRVIVQPDMGAYAAAQLARLPRVQLLPHTDVHPQMDKTDVAHRPYQVSNANDLLMLSCAGERQVITHQDLIAYRNPGYFAGFPQWDRHRRLTREALTFADQVVFFSHHALKDAFSEDLVEPERARVVYIGVDHSESVAPEQRHPPQGAESLAEQPFLVCLGTDFRHKNRVFALRLFDALRERHGWQGRLVLAGPRVSDGSSAGEEATYLATRPELAKGVLTLPAVAEAEKEWLLEHCLAVLYPTTYEGFGLMPFEAADHGRPCLFASQTALAELLPAELATLVPWDPRESAARVSALLAQPEAIHAHVLAIRRAAGPLTWKSTAEALLDVYFAAAASPTREAAQMAESLLVVESERDELQRKYTELWQSLTPDARTLAGPGAQLDPAAQRSLAAIVKRPLLRRMLLGPATLAQRVRRLGRPAPAPPAPPTSPHDFELHFAWANEQHMNEQIAGDSAPPAGDLGHPTTPAPPS
jgi:GT2 family glycosyltransferase/glycosyltransferase involved in cell wall biosynthesis